MYANRMSEVRHTVKALSRMSEHTVKILNRMSELRHTVEILNRMSELRHIRRRALTLI